MIAFPHRHRLYPAARIFLPDYSRSSRCAYAQSICIAFEQEDKIKSLIDAAGVKIEPYWPSMFSKLLETVQIDDLINNIGAAPAAGGGAAPAAGDAGGAAAPAEEEKKEESEEEEEEDMDFDLFD